MVTQRVVWTLLPNGINKESNRARASVLVSPRLSLPNTVSPPNLSQFPYWLDWPAIMQGASFKVVVNGAASVDAQLTSSPDSAVWQAIFPSTTFVRPWAFDAAGLTNKFILSYPVTGVVDIIEKLYGQIGALDIDGLPPRRSLRLAVNGSREDAATLTRVPGAGRGVRPNPMTPGQVLERLRRDSKGRDYNPNAGPKAGANQGLMADPDHALDLLQAYHTPLEAERIGKYGANQQPDGYAAKFPGKENPFRHAQWKTRDKTPLPSPSDYKDLIDFHQITAALCQYPDLNKRCGLVLDLEFDLPGNAGQSPTLHLEADWQTAPADGVTTEPDVKPKIVANVSQGNFYAAKKIGASPILERYLRLVGEDFSLVQMDVDGAGLKLKNFGESLKNDVPVEYDDESFEEKQEPEAGLPSLRTAGIMLAEKRRDLSLTALLQRAENMQSTLANTTLPPTLYAEDVIRGYRADIFDDDSKKWRSLFFRSTNFTFTNTNGGVTTPKEEGMARVAAGGSTDNTNTDVMKIHEGLLNWSGWSLAAPEPGNLIRRDDEQDPPYAAENEETPPGLPLKTKYQVVSGTLPRLRFGRTYRMRVRLVDLAGASAEFSEDNVQPKGAESAPVKFLRHEPVEPPALALVSQNGSVDPLGEGESMQRMAIRTFNDTPDKNTIASGQTARRHLAPTRVGHRFAEFHGVLDTGPNGAVDTSLYPLLVKLDKPLPEIEIDRGKDAVPGEKERYAFADETFELPYLPDPLAVAVAIRVTGADGVDSTKIHRIPLYCTGTSRECQWPFAKPLKIVASESGMPDAKFDEGSREFRIPMGKAERARVYVSSLIPKTAHELFAVRQMILKQNPAANIEKRIGDGRHWMFTPWRIVEIVHAVQKPLITPEITNLNINRDFGDTAARPGIESLPLHSKSTARVDMSGVWADPVDNPADLQAAEGPYFREQRAEAFQRKIARNDALDGKYNYFTGKHVFQNTSYRRVKYKLDATTRYKEFFNTPIRSDENNLKVTSQERVGWVPNSAPPPAPNVLYVVPTFGWVRSSDNNKSTSLRAGGGLRVYLDRPWMTTGFTEMLGVVLPYISNQHPVSNAVADEKYKGSITMWGADPIWSNQANITSAAPPLSAFPLRRTNAPITFEGSGLPEEEGTDLPPGDFIHTNLPHPEIDDSDEPYQDQIRLSVAPHVVGYDPERNLWYSDIVIRPPTGTYYPFVRLALSRYNPISVYRAHLSAMALTEFQQLTPDRLVVVTKSASAGTAHIAVYGVAGQKMNIARLEPDRFEAVTQVLSAGADPDLGWRTVEADELSTPQLTARPAQSSTSARRAAPLTTARRAAPVNNALRLEAERALEAEDLNALVARPDLMIALQPPLLWETEIVLPERPTGGSRRILVTEKEYYIRQFDDLGAKSGISTATQLGGRVVYMETLDI